jgi:molybdopterin converting factor small subunit
MQLRVLAFSVAREALGFSEKNVECAPEETPRQIFGRLNSTADLAHMRVAVDLEYRRWDEPIGNSEELAIFPPVSGG